MPIRWSPGCTCCVEEPALDIPACIEYHCEDSPLASTVTVYFNGWTAQMGEGRLCDCEALNGVAFVCPLVGGSHPGQFGCEWRTNFLIDCFIEPELNSIGVFLNDANPQDNRELVVTFGLSRWIKSFGPASGGKILSCEGTHDCDYVNTTSGLPSCDPDQGQDPPTCQVILPAA